MKATIDKIRTIRTSLLSLIENLSIDQLNHIPEGFNNNIIWNLGHLVAAQQGLCYLRSGLQATVDDKLIQLYKPETKPAEFVDDKEFEAIKQLLMLTLDRLEVDYQNNIFNKYNAFTTRFGVQVANVNEAIEFLLFHEGLHFGYVMALKRVVTKHGVEVSF
jgi:hypothetical protein